MLYSDARRFYLFSLFISCLLVLTACGRSKEPTEKRSASNGKEKIEKFFLPKATLRVDERYLITAKKVELLGVSTGKDLKKVILLFVITRRDLNRLRPPHFDLDLSNKEMLTLNPTNPIYIEVVMKRESLRKANQLYKKNGRLANLVKAVDRNGFPFLLDLEHYTLKKWLQETGKRIKMIK